MSYASCGSDLVILGSGTCVPSLRRSSSAVLLRSGDLRLLVDMGPGTIRRLLEVGENIFDVSFVLLSHFHPDHAGEVASFLFANKYPDGDLRKRCLNVIGGRGLTDFYSGLKYAYGHVVELPKHLFRLVEMDTKEYDIQQFEMVTVRSIPVEHRPESIAYRITVPGGISVAFSGDTDYCDRLVDLARDADVLVCESSFPDSMKVKGHLTPSLAGEIAARAHAGKLVLTHFYPECDMVDMQAQCRRSYSGPLVIAEDKMIIPLSPQ